jgi:hypothetical protein
MTFPGLKRIALAALLACLGTGCEHTTIYEIRAAKPSDVVSRGTTEADVPSAPSAEGDAIIVPDRPDRKDDEIAISPDVPETPLEEGDSEAATPRPEASPEAVAGDEPAGPSLEAPATGGKVTQECEGDECSDLPHECEGVACADLGGESGMIRATMPHRDSSSDQPLTFRATMPPPPRSPVTGTIIYRQ